MFTQPTLAIGSFERRRAVAAVRKRLFGAADPVTIGRYRVDAQLGIGGMGEVYLGFDPELERKVAIKCVRSETGRARMHERLRQEARALARLSHPNVVQIHEVGEHDGQTFIAMEFVEGQTLTRWLASPKRRRAILDMFVAAGRGLAAAHSAGVVHRDFKPDNVLVGSDGRPRVADFGLAVPGPIVEAEVTTGELTHLTETGAMVGTARYMAYEQLRGHEVDARSDQFSFCVALYEALCGKPPFALDSLDARITALEHERVVRPGPRIPRWLWTTIRRGLRRDPEQRWASMDTLLAALCDDPTRGRVILCASVVALGVSLGVPGWTQIERQRAIAACEVEGRAVEAVWNDDVRAQTQHALTSPDRANAPQLWSRTRALVDAYARAWASTRVDVCVAEADKSLAVEDAERARACLDERLASLDALTTILSTADETPDASFAMTVGLPPLADCVDARALARRVPLPDDADTREQIAALRERLSYLGMLEIAASDDDIIAEAEVLLDEAQQLGWIPIEAEAQYRVASLAAACEDFERARAGFERALLLAGESGHEQLAIQAAAKLAEVADPVSVRPSAAPGPSADPRAQVTNRAGAARQRASHPPRPGEPLLAISQAVSASLGFGAAELDRALASSESGLPAPLDRR